MEIGIAIGGGILAAIIIFHSFRRPVTVMEYQQGLRYNKGRYVGIVEPGRYWVNPRTTKINIADVREQLMTISGQEVMSQDGVSLKLSIAIRYRVADAHRAYNEVENCHEVLYADLQIQLRTIVGGSPIEELLEKRSEFGQMLAQMGADGATRVGLELLGVEIKDIMFPGELKKVFTQVVKARQEGLATLERARGETAALRNLANAAEAVERNPALLQLRTLQALSTSTGNTFVINMGPPGQVIPTPLQQSSNTERADA